MMRRPIIFILFIVGLLLLLGWLIFSIDWGGSNQNQPPAEVNQQKLVDFANTGTRVRFIEKGAIVNDDEHRQVWITVGRGEVSAEIKQGYEGNTIKSTRTANNENAYRVFLAALAVQDFDRTKTYNGLETEDGSCPRGRRFVYEVFNANETLLHSWTNSCSRSDGTFDGRRDNVTQLFRAQVPDYNQFVRGHRL